MSYGISGVSGAQPPGPGGTTTPNLRAFANLGLSDTQTSQIRSILSTAQQNGQSPADTQAAIDAVLTPAQQTTLANNVANAKQHHGGHHRGSGSDPLANLDLTQSQQSQVQSILASAKQNGSSQADVQSQINAILTPTQQQQLQTNQQNAAPSGSTSAS